VSDATSVDPEEAAFDRVFSIAPPIAPPVGFRDGVMRRVRGRTSPALEWIVAGALALPSLVFLVWEIATEGLDIETAFDNVMAFTGGSQDQAFFFVDGLLVVAFALLGLGALVGSHALLRHR
jgi:hypothetical protein